MVSNPGSTQGTRGEAASLWRTHARLSIGHRHVNPIDTLIPYSWQWCQSYLSRHACAHLRYTDIIDSRSFRLSTQSLWHHSHKNARCILNDARISSYRIASSCQSISLHICSVLQCLKDKNGNVVCQALATLRRLLMATDDGVLVADNTNHRVVPSSWATHMESRQIGPGAPLGPN